MGVCQSIRDTMKLIHVALGGLLMLLVAACSSSSHAADPPPASTPSSTAAPAGSYAIPRVITVAYVNSVLKALNHVNGNAARELARTHEINSVVKSELRAIFNDPAYELQLEGAEQSLRQGVISNVRPAGGDVHTSVLALLTATKRCIFFQSTSDSSGLFSHPTASPASAYIELLPKQPGHDPEHLDSTPWAFSLNEAFLTPSSVPNPCPY
jgi:hypothetical protein